MAWLLAGWGSPAPRQQSQISSPTGAVACAHRAAQSSCAWREGSLPACPAAACFPPQAFSAFFYTVDFIQTVMGRTVRLPSDLKDAAETICATSWGEVGSPGMVGRGGLLRAGHHPVLRAALGGGWVSSLGAGRGWLTAQVGMGSALASQMQPPRVLGHRNKAWTLLA